MISVMNIGLMTDSFPFLEELQMVMAIFQQLII